MHELLALVFRAPKHGDLCPNLLMDAPKAESWRDPGTHVHSHENSGEWRERVRTLRQLSVWAPTDNQNRLSRSQSSIEGDFYFWRDMTYDWSQRCKGVVTQYSSGQLVQRQLIQHGHNTHQSSAVSDHKDPTLFIQH